MKTSKFATGVAVVAILFTAGAVLAKPGERSMRMSFEQIDANADGQITRAEIDDLRAERFAKVDADGDGGLSLDELTREATENAADRAEKMMKRLDANADGTLSPEELGGASRATRLFDRVDRNDDGIVTKAEFDAAKERMKERYGKKQRSE